MTAKEAYDILVQHNMWRRDNCVPSKYEMVNPTELGVAIDIAIIVLSDYINRNDFTEEGHANYSPQLDLPFSD